MRVTRVGKGKVELEKANGKLLPKETEAEGGSSLRKFSEGDKSFCFLLSCILREGEKTEVEVRRKTTAMNFKSLFPVVYQSFVPTVLTYQPILLQ